MRLLIVAIAVAACAACACFAPDERDGTVKCAPEPDPCPPDFVCGADHLCRRPGAVDAGPLPEPDAGKHRH